MSLNIVNFTLCPCGHTLKRALMTTTNNKNHKFHIRFNIVKLHYYSSLKGKILSGRYLVSSSATAAQLVTP